MKKLIKLDPIEACKKGMEIWIQAHVNRNESIIKLDGYEVSNLGNIRSYWRNKTQPEPIKPYKRNGYRTVSLATIDKKQVRADVHRLVMDSWRSILTTDPPGISTKDWRATPGNVKIFIGSLLQVNHKNHDKLDNNLLNLERVTPKQNSKEAVSFYEGNCNNKSRMIKIKRYAILDREGKLHVGRNLQKFCDDMATTYNTKVFRRDVQKLLSGKIKMYKGLRRANDHYVDNKIQKIN
jgi:hypothetical protein